MQQRSCCSLRLIRFYWNTRVRLLAKPEQDVFCMRYYGDDSGELGLAVGLDSYFDFLESEEGTCQSKTHQQYEMLHI